MINFFRNIRKRLADDNKPLKYLRYALGEIVLVVIGILIALQINNWNEGRKAQAKTNAYLVMLSDEIKGNLWLLDRSKKMAEEHRDYNLNSLLVLNSDSAKTIDIDTFYGLTVSKGPFGKMELVRSSFDDLINSGSLENVRDSTLRNQVFRIESAFKSFENQYNAVWSVWEQQIRPYHLEHLNESRMVTRWRNLPDIDFDTDMEAFVYNRKYANMLSGNIIFIGNYIRAIENIQERFTATLDNIKSYLNKEPSKN